MKKGDLVEWVAGDRWIGPNRKFLAIRKGERRRVVEVIPGVAVWLEGSQGEGSMFGEVDPSNVRLIE